LTNGVNDTSGKLFASVNYTCSKFYCQMSTTLVAHIFIDFIHVLITFACLIYTICKFATGVVWLTPVANCSMMMPAVR
jgi:hypothetical protein